MNQRNPGNTGKQSGTTLVVALLLILLASLLTLFAVNVGIFDQRSSAADVRARLVRQAAEAALSQGIEHIKLNSQTLLDATDAALWAPCKDADTFFPCGAAPACAIGEAPCANDSLGISTARRSQMYYYIGGAGYDVNGIAGSTDLMDKHSLPLDRLINSTNSTSTGVVGNNYAVNYGVGVLLCLVRNTAPTEAVPIPPTECTTDISEASNIKIITLVATATIPKEGARTTLSMMIGVYSPKALNNPSNTPSINSFSLVPGAWTDRFAY